MTWTELVRPSAGDTLSLTTFWDLLSADLQHLHNIAAYNVTNNSGVALVAGDVVVIDATVDAKITTSVTVGDLRQIGVVLDATLANLALGYVGIAGHITTVNVQGTVARGDPLQISATTKRAQTGNVGAFAVALTPNASGAGTVQALLFNGASLRDAPRVSALYDTGNVNRFVPNSTAKTIADASATALFEVAVAAGASASGVVHFSVFASDGTDHQVFTGILSYAAVNKSGTCTRTIVDPSGNDAKAVSSGTLTLAWTLTDDTNKVTLRLQPTGSLTETTYTVLYTVLPLRGTVTIL